MRVIYAFYSKPFGSSIKNKTHWAEQHIEFFVLAYSVMKCKEFGFETVLFCDKYGKELIIDTFQIPFDIVKVELDFCEVKLKWWASGKIYAYTKGIKSLGKFKPFMMLDNDAGWHNKPPKHYLESKYRCQSIHIDTNTEWERLVLRVVRDNPNVYPFDIYHDMVNQRQGIKGGNAGVVIINDERLLDEFNRYAWDLMEHPYFDNILSESKELNPYRAMNKWNVLIEENLLLQLSRRLNNQLPETVHEFTGFATPLDNHNPTGFFHIWGSKKNIKYLKTFEDLAVSYIPIHITNGIREFFKLR